MRRLTFASLAVLASLAGPALGQGLEDVRTGNEAFKEGRFAEAVAAYSRVIDAGSVEGESLAITRNNRGVAYGEMGRYDAAIDDYKASLALRPDDLTTVKNLRVAHVRRGRNRLNAGDYAGARADYDEAIRLEPDHYLAWLRRGELEEEQGELEAAMADYAEARKRSPDSGEVRQAIDRAQGLMASLGKGARTASAKAETKPPVEGSKAPAAGTETAEATPPADTTESAAKSEVKSGSTVSATPNGGPATAQDEAPAASPAGAPPSEATKAVKTEASGPAMPADEPVTARVEAPATPPAVAPEPAPKAGTVKTAEPAIEPAAAPPATVSSAPADEGPGGRWRAKQSVNVRVGPNNGAESLGAIGGGVEVQVIGDELGWKHVILPNGQRGYIYKRWLQPIGG
ncbi:MAG: tetratricopeptide repeat protein [Geminicoccaceae bacterium]|nr:tetratricopeptide repeat protein [Geminicoccaceae bacterium]